VYLVSVISAHLTLLPPTFPLRFVPRRWQALKATHLEPGGLEVFGEVQHMWTRLEFQDRGSPHVHALIWCKDRDRAARGISAMMPRADNLPPSLSGHVAEMEGLVHQFKAIHKCNHSCLRDGTCFQGFPKEPNDLTTATIDPDTDFAVYPRRGPDQFVLPYSPEILHIWRSSVNVQLVSNTHWIRYMVKYNTKQEPHGPVDISALPFPATAYGFPPGMSQEHVFEAARALDYRVMSSCEAAVLLIGIPLFETSIGVFHINVQMPGEQRHAVDRKDGAVIANHLEKYAYRAVTHPTLRHELRHLRLPEYLCQWEVVRDENRIPKTARDKHIDEIGNYVFRRNKKLVPRMPFIRPDQGDVYFFILFLKTQAWDGDLLQCMLSLGAQTWADMTVKAGILSPLDDPEQLGPNSETFKMLKSINAGAMESYLVGQAKVVHESLVHLLANPHLAADGGAGVNRCLDLDATAFEDEQQYHIDVADELNRIKAPEKINVRAVRAAMTDDQAAIFDLMLQLKQRRRQGARQLPQVLTAVIGPAGTGKTFLYKNSWAVLANAGVRVIATATTNKAATLLGCETVHTAFAVTANKKISLKSNPKRATMIKYAEVVFIDEVSMLRADTLEAISWALQQSAAPDRRHLPFGGRSVIVWGDFHQLPAVVPDAWGRKKWGMQVYNAPVWRHFRYSPLNTNVRQANDADLAAMLTNLRNHENLDAVLDYLETRRHDGPPGPGTVIRGRRADVARANDAGVHLMPGDATTVYPVYYKVLASETHKTPIHLVPNIVLQDARKNHKAFTEPITLKVGAPIVLTGNVDPRRGLVNNTHGRVAGFIYDNQGALSAITATFGDRTHNISRLHRILGGPDPTTGRRGHTHTWHVNHFPVAATFALTCHRAQGETITNDMYVSLNDLWESGQVYVTLSRCAEGKHLHILDFDRRLILASINKTAISPRVLRALAYLKERPAFTSLAIWEIHEKTPMPYLPSGGAVHPPRLQFRSGL